MISMDNWATQAFEKLKKEKPKVTGQKEKAMADAVMEIIELFCQQEPEFAQAVVQGQSFADCMKKVAAGIGSSIKDLDAYKRAVQFYFPGAQVHMELTIDLVGATAEPALPAETAEPAAMVVPTHELEGAKGKILTLDLDDLFSF